MFISLLNINNFKVMVMKGLRTHIRIKCMFGGGRVVAAKFYFLETPQGLEMMSVMVEVCSYLRYDFSFTTLSSK